MAKILEKSEGFRERLIFHFTCLEMKNGSGEFPYERPENLVFWVAKAAEELDLPIKGENALSGGVTNDEGWNMIENAMDHAAYRGITVLRIDQVTADNTGKRRFRQFTEKY